MRRGFHIGRPVEGAAPGCTPMLDRLRDHACGREVVGDQLGSGVADLRELPEQRFGDSAVILLPRAPQQRPISGVTNKRVFEAVARLRRQAFLMKELALDKLLQSIVQGRFVQG
jgi:hypothetical protein